MDLADDVAVARLAISLLDLTDLAEPTDADAADRLCARARAAGVAAVCVWPEYVALCVDRLAGSGVRVATVVNFPTGDFPIDDVIELDPALRSPTAPTRSTSCCPTAPGSPVTVDPRRRRAATASHAVAPTVKVIIESGELPDRAADRPRHPLRHRPRRRLREDVDRQDTDRRPRPRRPRSSSRRSP